MSLLLIASTPVLAAGFDCKKAHTEIEKTICSNDRLSTLDLELNQIFKLARMETKDKQSLISGQSDWLKNTRDLCKSADCLQLVYINRISDLKSKITTSPYEAGYFLNPATDKPLATLAEESEIYVISGYEPLKNVVSITVDRPNSKVILVVSSYEPTIWKISATPKTQIGAIFFGGNQTIFSNKIAPLYKEEIPYTTEIDNRNFQTLLSKLNDLIKVKNIDYFLGNYKIPSTVVIDQFIREDKKTLSLDGPKIQTPKSNWEFDLLTDSNKIEKWTLQGPKTQVDSNYVFQGRLLSSKTEKVFSIKNHNFEILNIKNGNKYSPTMPMDFPKISWPTDITYDARRNYYSIVSYGGEGYLYRYNPDQDLWIDFNSAKNFDISSIFYDKTADRYVAWANFINRGSLVIFDGDGKYVSDKYLTEKLEGFGRLYDKGNEAAAPLKIVSNGNAIALIAMSAGKVTHIWLYDMETDKAILTYKRATHVLNSQNGLLVN
ncbi:lysozyme inhibitor LprI family protein [Cellvibrio fontiphilus]|uniref:Lysozyme inhibitor LprI family protein n=1 Tax=Cellvibrio fontiphilus TaxID=1815559 RepID=A0ABV7FAW2_9GAMM